MADAEVIDRPERNRFELAADGQIAFAVYSRQGAVLTLTHTIVRDALAGRGIGSKLIGSVLRQVRERRLKIVPQCSFVVAFLEKHPEERDLVADGAVTDNPQ